KISLAAYSLAFTSLKFHEDKNENFAPVFISLGNIMNEIEVNVGFYSLHGIDHQLISKSLEVIQQVGSSRFESNSDEIDTILGGIKNKHSKATKKTKKPSLTQDDISPVMAKKRSRRRAQ